MGCREAPGDTSTRHPGPAPAHPAQDKVLGTTICHTYLLYCITFLLYSCINDGMPCTVGIFICLAMQLIVCKKISLIYATKYSSKCYNFQVSVPIVVMHIYKVFYNAYILIMGLIIILIMT